MTLPLSVFIIAKNEADRIGRTIRSVRGFVDEIVVLDSGSTDETVQVARESGADIVEHRDWDGYGPQKIAAEALCKHRWLLNLDADEEVTPALRAQIEALFAPEPGEVAYRLDAVQVFPGDHAARAHAPSTKVVRLYDRTRATWRNSPVHDSVILKSTGEIPACPLLSAPLNHYSFRNLAHMIEKMNYYSTMQAHDLHARGVTVSDARLIAEPFTAYIKYYFTRRFCLMGPMGVVYACVYACWRTLRLAKLREMQRSR